jgi:hypothetical protein
MDDQEETYDEPNDDWIDRHSVGCFICANLVDERDCVPGPDGEGSICPDCQVNSIIARENDES